MAYQESASAEGPAAKLAQFLQTPNIADILDAAQLGKMAGKVLRGYDIDKASRKSEGWEQRLKDAVELAMLVAKQKNYPFNDAANIKYPLITDAAYQFNALAYPAIVQGSRVAKCKVWGTDTNGTKAQRADRVSEHLSYQLLTSPEWEKDTDRMLVMLPIVGCMFRKVYFDPAIGKKVTRLSTPEKTVVNYWARSLQDAPRITEELELYPYEIEERIRDGRFIEWDYGQAQNADGDDTAPHTFLEQHCQWDLDEDDYPEPYIVTVHKQSQKCVRIVPNYTGDTVQFTQDGRVASIRKQDFFVQYDFLPSPDGSFYGIGFGWFLKDIQEAVNTTANQLLDAGHLATIQGGIISTTLGIKDKTIRLNPGEWKVWNAAGSLRDAVMPIKYDGPNPQVFALMQFLIDAGKGLAAIKDIMTGDTGGKVMQPTTVIALIEQGMKVFTAIFKRVHNSLKAELAIHARINREKLAPEEYSLLFDDMVPAVDPNTGQAIAGPDGQPQMQPAVYDPQTDYAEDDMDILPVSDPQVATRMQELAKAQFLLEASSQRPEIYNHVEVHRRLHEAAQTEDADQLFTQPNPEQVLIQRLATMLGMELQKAEIVAKYAEALAKRSGAIKNIAEAEAVEPGQQLDLYALIAKMLTTEIKAENDERRLQPVAGQPGNPGTAQAAA